MGISRGGLQPTLDFKFSAKRLFFSFEFEKTNYTTFAPSLEKFWKNALVASHGKIPTHPRLLSPIFLVSGLQ